MWPQMVQLELVLKVGIKIKQPLLPIHHTHVEFGIHLWLKFSSFWLDIIQYSLSWFSTFKWKILNSVKFSWLILINEICLLILINDSLILIASSWWAPPCWQWWLTPVLLDATLFSAQCWDTAVHHDSGLRLWGFQLSSHQCHQTQGCWWSMCSHDSHVSTCYQGLLWFNGNLWYHVLPYKVVNIGSGNGLVPDGTKPLPESVLTLHQCGCVTLTWLYLHDCHVSTCSHCQGLLWFNGNLWYRVLSCKVVNIGSGNGLVPDGTKPLPESVLTLHQCGCVTLTCTCMSVMSVPAVTARACFDLMETCDTVYCHAKWSTLVQVMAWHQDITWISVDLGVAVRLCGIDLMALAQVMARSQHKEVPVVQKVFDMGVRLWFRSDIFS